MKKKIENMKKKGNISVLRSQSYAKGSQWYWDTCAIFLQGQQGSKKIKGEKKEKRKIPHLFRKSIFEESLRLK